MANLITGDVYLYGKRENDDQAVTVRPAPLAFNVYDYLTVEEETETETEIAEPEELEAVTETAETEKLEAVTEAAETEGIEIETETEEIEAVTEAAETEEAETETQAAGKRSHRLFDHLVSEAGGTVESATDLLEEESQLPEETEDSTEVVSEIDSEVTKELTSEQETTDEVEADLGTSPETDTEIEEDIEELPDWLQAPNGIETETEENLEAGSETEEETEKLFSEQEASDETEADMETSPETDTESEEDIEELPDWLLPSDEIETETESAAKTDTEIETETPASEIIYTQPATVTLTKALEVSVSGGTQRRYTYRYQVDGLKVQVLQYAEGSDEALTAVTQTYAENGLLVSRSWRNYADGSVTEESYEYDEKNRVVSCIKVSAGENETLQISYQYDDTGKLVAISDDMDTVYELEWDGDGRVASYTINPADPVNSTTHTYTYGEDGLIGQEIYYGYDETDDRAQTVYESYEYFENTTDIFRPMTANMVQRAYRTADSEEWVYMDYTIELVNAKIMDGEIYLSAAALRED